MRLPVGMACALICSLAGGCGSIGITLDLYSQVPPGMEADATERVVAALQVAVCDEQINLLHLPADALSDLVAFSARKRSRHSNL
jgi:hypothetical protein